MREVNRGVALLSLPTHKFFPCPPPLRREQGNVGSGALVRKLRGKVFDD
jgi:hypothetical protein